jgi:putative ABC transport system substrate-binding protein
MKAVPGRSRRYCAKLPWNANEILRGLRRAMKRREFIALLGGAAAAVPLSARAQPASGRPLVGVLVPISAAAAARNIEALRAGLREFRYVEGRNIWLEFRYADGVSTRLAALAAELAARKPDIIVAGSPAGALAAHGATRTIPIVMISLLDPVTLGVVKSIARPGGNVTGIWSAGGNDALIGKRIDLLKEIVPGLSRMGILVDPRDPADAIVLRFLPAAARALGVTYQVFEVRTPDDLDAAFAQAARDGIQGLFINQTPFFLSNRAKIVALAAGARLPAIYGFREFAVAGGLMAYGSSLPGAYTQVARLVDKILKGAKPADLPVEQATNYELVVNLKTAKALGLKIPASFLLRADEVIE